MKTLRQHFDEMMRYAYPAGAPQPDAHQKRDMLRVFMGGAVSMANEMRQVPMTGAVSSLQSHPAFKELGEFNALLERDPALHSLF